MTKPVVVVTKLQGTVQMQPLRKLVSDASWVALVTVYRKVGGKKETL